MVAVANVFIVRLCVTGRVSQLRDAIAPADRVCIRRRSIANDPLIVLRYLAS
jgi:hypothetical protein